MVYDIFFLVVKPLMYKSNDYASMVRDEVAHV